MSKRKANRRPASQPKPKSTAPKIKPAHVGFASFSNRGLATIVDFVILLPLLAISLLLNSQLDDRDPARIIWTVLAGAASLVYHVIFTMRGGTPGYRTRGLRVQSPDGTDPTLRQAAIRSWDTIVTFPIIWGGLLLTLVADLDKNVLNPFLLPGDHVRITAIPQAIWLLGCFTIFTDPQKRALHDKWADTMAIKAKAEENKGLIKAEMTILADSVQ